jgi:hypothetical protein
MRPAPAEGETRADLSKVSISPFDQGIYPDDDVTAQARLLLAQRCGRPVEEVIQELDGRPTQWGRRLPRSAAHADEIPEYEIIGDEG